jgi:hypothetical protein
MLPGARSGRIVMIIVALVIVFGLVLSSLATPIVY